MFRLFRFLGKKDWLYMALSVVFIAMQVWLDLKLPDYMQEITMLVETPGSDMADVWHNGLLMVACAFGSLVSAVIVAFFASKISAKLSYNLKKGIYNKVDSFSMEEINKFSTASLITRSTNDITQVQMFLFFALQILIKAPLIAIWAIIKIADKGLEWTLATGCAVLALVLVIGILIIVAMPKFKKMQTLTDNMNKATRENLTGVRVVRAFNAEGYQSKKYENANDDLTKTVTFTNKVMAFLMPFIFFIMNAISLAIFWIGAYLVDKADMVDKINVFANMVVYTSYAMQVVMAFLMLIMVFMMLPRASVSAKRLNEVLDTKPKIVDGAFNGVLSGENGEKADVTDNEVKGKIEFKNVSFSYPDASEKVLENVSFVVNKGETIAFIGSTGSGKSTLINLIPRFYDATSGEVLIDDVNVKDYTENALHSKIGYISQKAVIFSGTVRSNIAFGEKSGDDSGLSEAEIDAKVKRSAEIAMASDFIEKLDGGYDAVIAQSGTNLSGGQKQRISIARAIAREPEILVFDDSFSALDYKTDKALRANLSREISSVTKVIVAQRIGTILDADKIVVLDSGKVVGMGNHKELMQSCEIYREIALSQLSKEELENE